MPERASIFISYSHRDKAVLEDLRRHLKTLERDGLVNIWDDRRIRPGEVWGAEIEQAIAQARGAVFLVSSSFLASDFIVEKELAPLFRRACDEGLVPMWIAVSPCRWDRFEMFQRYQALIDPKLPLDRLSPAEREAALDRINRQIERTLSPATEEQPYRAAFERLRAAREQTLALSAELSTSELAAPSPEARWNAAQLLEHLLLIDDFFKRETTALTTLARRGEEPVLRRSFRYFNLKLPGVPDALLPFAEVPLALASRAVPFEVLERLATDRRFRLQAAPAVQPCSSFDPAELRGELARSLEEIDDLFRRNGNLDFEALRHHNPITGSMTSLEAMRFIAAHERRHQAQLRELLGGAPAPAALPRVSDLLHAVDGRPGVALEPLRDGLTGVAGAIRLPFGLRALALAGLPDRSGRSGRQRDGG